MVEKDEYWPKYMHIKLKYYNIKNELDFEAKWYSKA
jgi:hypothetical protein